MTKLPFLIELLLLNVSVSSQVIESLRTELQKLFHQHFFKTISLSGKLAPIYSKVKKEYREESYISGVEYYKYRSAMTKFGISAHNLPIEKGRWEGIDKTERRCKNASIMMLGMKTTISYTVMHLI